jgi:ferredoxin-NADP reductase
MARAALLGRLTWRVATVVSVRDETPTARSLVLEIPGWPGHDAGQHLDVRLTAPDGYRAVRSYSIASVPDGDRVELTVELAPDGEVSSYLVQVASVGDQIEIRGPVGGWFVWRPEQAEPVQLVGGGSGIVPLMAMARRHAEARSRAPVRLLYSARAPESVIYRAELDRLAGPGGTDGTRGTDGTDGTRGTDGTDGTAEISYAYTRAVPPGWPRPAGRIDAGLLAAVTFPPDRAPTCYVCGPTGFVETVADLLVQAGHDSSRIRTERFGPSGGPR